ncbi:hypothetical protein C2S51_003447 [Perilla frutescens var. frutescens]|nr:hypothetical protein C2S51_003447 [Perilla frutescens var. frutescens]
MGEAVIVSAIEKLGNWLLKKADLRDDEREKLSSLVVEKADLCSVVVGMVELWENNKEMLYRLLIRVAYPSLEEEEEEESIFAEKVSSLVFEIADLWEDDDKASIFKKNLHSLLLDMIHDRIRRLSGTKAVYEWHYKDLYSLAIEMAEDGKGKLSKEKLCTWLAEKADLWHQKSLFHLLRDLTTVLRGGILKREFRMTDVLKKVEEAKNDLMIILDINKSEHLRYFISDAAEMAHDASLFIAVMDSDPIIFFLELLNCFFKQQMSEDEDHPLTTFSEEIASIQKWLQETKERMLEFGSAESQINYVGEELQLEGTCEDVVGLEEDVELMLLVIHQDVYTSTCINGMGGIGKTTLARVLYNHPKIVDRFEGRAWVCDSSWKLSRKELLINLIRQLHSKEFCRDDDVDDMLMILEQADNRSLRQMLHQQLQCKPYFIVLDDVSENRHLKYLIRHALPAFIHEERYGVNHPIKKCVNGLSLWTKIPPHLHVRTGINAQVRARRPPRTCALALRVGLRAQVSARQQRTSWRAGACTRVLGRLGGRAMRLGAHVRARRSGPARWPALWTKSAWRARVSSPTLARALVLRTGLRAQVRCVRFGTGPAPWTQSASACASRQPRTYAHALALRARWQPRTYACSATARWTQSAGARAHRQPRTCARALALHSGLRAQVRAHIGSPAPVRALALCSGLRAQVHAQGGVRAETGMRAGARGMGAHIRAHKGISALAPLSSSLPVAIRTHTNRIYLSHRLPSRLSPHKNISAPIAAPLGNLPKAMAAANPQIFPP